MWDLDTIKKMNSDDEVRKSQKRARAMNGKIPPKDANAAIGLMTFIGLIGMIFVFFLMGCASKKCEPKTCCPKLGHGPCPICPVKVIKPSENIIYSGRWNLYR